MAESPRYTPEQLSILLRIAAGKLGRDPVQLQEELQNGKLDGLLQSLGADRERALALLNDREGLTRLLQSEQVRSLLQQSYDEAKQVLAQHRALLDEIALYLLQKETITGDELMTYVNAESQRLPAADEEAAQ